MLDVFYCLMLNTSSFISNALNPLAWMTGGESDGSKREGAAFFNSRLGRQNT